MHLTFLLLGTSSSFVFPLAAFSSFARTSSGESRRADRSVQSRIARREKGRGIGRKPTDAQLGNRHDEEPGE